MWFQSSPARGGGCNGAALLSDIACGVVVSILTRPWGRVQQVVNPRAPCAVRVSILTRPWGRVQPQQQEARAEAVRVSILTRPWGRVQPSQAAADAAERAVSILTRPWGRVQRPAAAPTAPRTARFNPHPPVGAGATCAPLFEDDNRSSVSILTRPWGRVQRGLENARERFPKRKCSSCQGVPCRALGG